MSSKISHCINFLASIFESKEWVTIMQLDRMTLGRMEKEMGFVRDTLEKMCRLADVLKFMEGEEVLSKSIALRGHPNCRNGCA